MIKTNFANMFGSQPFITGFTPGRVNLIGEHTDYNGGMVLPTALTLGLTLSMTPRGDNKIRIWSDKFDGIAERKLTDNATEHWSDYITGSIILSNERGFLNGGADISVNTTLPFGAGISSSAAVTVGTLKLSPRGERIHRYALRDYGPDGGRYCQSGPGLSIEYRDPGL